jgi:aryl-alcohol dehydrogenase-like predicted oxidoreductase
MDYRLLGGSGLKVSALCFGTGTFGGGNDFFRVWGTTDAKEARHLLDIAIAAGVNIFDTADAYSNGLSEEVLGQAVAGRRDKVLIATKTANRMGPGPNDAGSSRHRLVTACEASLRRLGTDYIDLWQIHGFDALTPIEETLRAIDDLVRAGKVRYAGCSNFSGWHLMKSLAIADRYGWTRYVAHQVYYSLIGREFEWELMPLALDQKVGTMVWSPLAGGLLSGKVGRNRPAPAGSRTAEQSGRVREVPPEQLYPVLDALEAIAAECERTVAQVALRWLLQRPSIATVVFGARNEVQLRENLHAEGFTLTHDQMRRLDEASKVRPIYPYWHQRAIMGERNPPPVA